MYQNNKEKLKKIMYLVPRYHTNMVGSVKALKDRGYCVEILSSYQGLTEDHSLIIPTVLPQSTMSRLAEKLFGPGGGDKPYFFPSFYSTLIAIVNFKPDMLIIRNPKRIASIFGIVSAKLIGIKIVFHTQSRFDFWSERKRVIGSWCMSMLNAAWFSPLMTEIDKRLEKKSFFFVPFAVEGNLKPRNLRKPTNIMMIGKYKDIRKNHDLFIEAVVTIRKSLPVNALIIGEVADEEGLIQFNRLKNKVEILGASKYIQLKKNIKFGLMKEFYWNADLFVLAASNEPVGISVLEAISNGIPAICSSTCGSRSYIHSGKNGRVFEDGRIDELTESIFEIISDEYNYSFFSKAAIFSSSAFSHEAFINALQHLYNSRWK